MKELPEIIKDGDLELRKAKATFENAHTVFSMVDKNRDYLYEFLSWPANTKTPEDSFGWLSASAQPKQEYLIYLDGAFVGVVGFAKWEPAENRRWCEIGYWVDKSVSGRGIMTRAVKMVERVAFESGEINRVQIWVDELNMGSRRVVEKAGYVFEGILRQFDKMGGGASGDIRSYSKLKSEWEAENA